MTGPESPPRKRGRLTGLENDEKEENMICLLEQYDWLQCNLCSMDRIRKYNVIRNNEVVERMTGVELPHI